MSRPYPPPTLEKATRMLAKPGEDIHTFCNGSHWEGWASHNCFECRWYDWDAAGASCAFEGAALLGVVSPELAEMFGWVQKATQYGPRDGWEEPEQCAFFREKPDSDEDDRERPTEPDPDQIVLIADPTEDIARVADAPIPAEHFVDV